MRYEIQAARALLRKLGAGPAPVSPWTAQAETHVEEWAAEFGLIRSAAAWSRFRATAPGELARPGLRDRRRPARLAAVTAWIGWLFLIDDQLDEGATGRDPALARDRLRPFADMAAGPSAETGRDGAGTGGARRRRRAAAAAAARRARAGVGLGGARHAGGLARYVRAALFRLPVRLRMGGGEPGARPGAARRLDSCASGARPGRSGRRSTCSSTPPTRRWPAGCGTIRCSRAPAPRAPTWCAGRTTC